MRKLSTKCALCRRAGDKLFLKGEKCLGPKCPFAKRSYPPGQHGPDQKRNKKLSGFGMQLKEKQKAKRIYGVMEKQFANYVAEASKKTGNTSSFFLGYLESRLDNVVFRAGMAKARSTARQLVRHGLVAVNGEKVDIPSYRVRVGEIISLSKRGKSRKGLEKLGEQMEKIEAPAWLGTDAKAVTAKVLNTPTVENTNFDANTIVEYYSR